MESPDIPDLLSCIPGQDHTPAPVRDGISSYAKRHFMMPGSKGLNPYPEVPTLFLGLPLYSYVWLELVPSLHFLMSNFSHIFFYSVFAKYSCAFTCSSPACARTY